MPIYARAIDHFGVKRAQRMLGLKVDAPGTPATEALAEAARRYHLSAIRLTVNTRPRSSRQGLCAQYMPKLTPLAANGQYKATSGVRLQEGCSANEAMLTGDFRGGPAPSVAVSAYGLPGGWPAQDFYLLSGAVLLVAVLFIAVGGGLSGKLALAL